MHAPAHNGLIFLVTERHQGRVINLEYNPLEQMAISDTVMLVGKVPLINVYVLDG